MGNVLTFTDRGIYCPAGDFYIDPWRPVARALITHGHADHARPGMGSYLCTDAAAPVIRYRLGDITCETVAYEKPILIGSALVSFHPAGHVPGSAQIRVSVGGEVWVVSGDYKTQADGLSEPFVPIKCHAFITECTFGLPIFRWPSQDVLADQLNTWWRDCAAKGVTAVLGAYSLGKAQRLLTTVDPEIGPILTHGAIENTNEILRDQGLTLPHTTRITPAHKIKDTPGALVITPPGAMEGAWMRKLGPTSTGFASGWMAVRGMRRRRSADRGFVVSDHADWAGLNWAIRETGAETVFATHGYTDSFHRWLRDQGYDAHVVSTDYHGDDSAQDDGAEAARGSIADAATAQ